MSAHRGYFGSIFAPPSPWCSLRRLWMAGVLVALLAGSAGGQTKEYIRLGGRVIAIESPGATSSGPATALVTSAGQQAPSNSFTVKAGLRFTVGSTPITVTSLGRRMVSASTINSHLLELWEADGTTRKAWATLPVQSGAVAGDFRYVTVSSPVTLAANGTYFLTSQELAGGDYFFMCSPFTLAGAVSGGVSAADSGAGTAIAAPSICTGGQTFSGPNLQYTTGAGGGGGGTASVVLTQPPPGFLNGTRTLTAVPTVSAGETVARVEFYDGAQKLGEDTQGPAYTWDWLTENSPGSRSVTALVITNSGLTATSPAVAYTVQQPTIAVTHPTTPVAGTITISATVTMPPSDTVAQVEVLANGVGLGTRPPGASYSWSFDTGTVAAANFTLQGRLTTTGGQIVYGSIVNVPIGSSGGGAGLPFLTSINTDGLAVQSAPSAKWGMKLTTGGAPLTVTELGRFVPAVTTINHTLQLWDGTGNTVLGEVTLPPQSTSGFRYASMSQPVTLAANTSYYVSSSEAYPYDPFFGCVPVTATAGGSILPASSWPNLAGPMVAGSCGGTEVKTTPTNFRYGGSGGGGGGGTGAVTVAPTGVQILSPGMARTFTAVVQGGGTVTWSPTSIPAAQGFVTITGNTLTYAAPASLASNVNLTFTATAGAQSATGSVQVNAVGIVLTDVRELGSMTPMAPPYTAPRGTLLNLTATVTGLAPGANGLVNWQVVSGGASVVSLAPAQVLSGQPTTLQLSSQLAGTVTLWYCSATDGTKCAYVTIQISQPTGAIVFRPQGSVFRLAPGAMLDFGIELINLTETSLSCALNPQWLGTLQQISNSGLPFARMYRFTAGFNQGPGDWQGQIECSHPTLGAGAKEVFPLTVSPAIAIAPSLTLSALANGNTTDFRKLSMLMGQNGSPLALSLMELVIAPTAQSFNQVNACAIEGSIRTGVPLLAMVDARLRTNDGNGWVASSATFFPNQYATGLWQNSQCSLSPVFSTAAMTAAGYATSIIQVEPAFRYTAGYVGQHNVYGKVHNSSGISSGWIAMAAPLTVQ